MTLASSASASPPSASKPASVAPAPAVIVFGLDDTGKAHASAFDASEVALAEKAAGIMGMSIVPITTDAERALAAKVPKGRLFASGRGFVPFVKAALYAELQALAAHHGVAASQPALATPLTSSGGATPPSTSSETNMSNPASQSVAGTGNAIESLQPTHWADIRIGAIVLAAIAPKHCEWFECEVVGTDKADGFTLRYCDWPKEPTFVRQRHELSLMHPSREVEPPAEADVATA
ncbi:hypothetical protein GGQ76_003670 [Aureimonas jatrophae]|nr:hypothetical protein [Aureimonas jatrophae]